jgi:peptidylprolyl isomerase
LKSLSVRCARSCLVAVLVAFATQASAQDATDRDRLLAKVEQFNAAIREGDVDKYADVFVEDFVFTWSRDGQVWSPESIFPNVVLTPDYSPLVDEVVVRINGDAAVVNYRSRTNADDSGVRVTFSFARVDGQWKAQAYQTTAVVEADAGAQSETARRTAQEVIDAAPDDAWRELDPDNTLYFGVAGERVVVELAPEFAPAHVENIKALVRGGYLDGGAINRAQDNYVVQWGTRPLADGESFPDDIARSLPAEFEVAAAELPFTPIVDGDVYAPEAGFVRGFPAGRDPASGVTWMAHCYGVVGVARGNDPDSGSGSALYVVIGHSPRHLDRNLSMVGRVVSGMEHLSTLPRGTSALGRYASREEWVPLEEARLGSDMSPEERAPLEIMRTESQSFRDLVVASRSRHEDFFVFPTNRVGLCNVRVPVR